MTLHKSIEAAREALRGVLDNVGWKVTDGKPEYIDATQQALSALPDKPKTESEIREKICRILHGQAYCNDKVDEQWTDFEDDANELIRALRDANVLYCSEEG